MMKNRVPFLFLAFFLLIACVAFAQPETAVKTAKGIGNTTNDSFNNAKKTLGDDQRRL